MSSLQTGPSPWTLDLDGDLRDRHPKKWLAEVTRCQSIELDFLVPKAEFDPSVLASSMPGLEDKDLTSGAVGPVRLGGLGRDDFRIQASIHLYSAPKPHYHVTVQGRASRTGFTPKKHWPTLAIFFETVSRGMQDPSDVDTFVVAQHRYPREWWKGAMELPVPLPPVPGEKPSAAELTGVEVSYKRDGGTDRVLLTSRGDDFRVINTFQLIGPVRPDLFTVALLYSSDLGKHLFEHRPRQVNND